MASLAWVDKIHVEMYVLAGNDLVAKDRNLLGRKTTSDPYVEVYLLNNPKPIFQNGQSITNYKIGKTSTVYKSLNPQWPSPQNKFVFEIVHPWRVTLKVYDEDLLSDPDLMGIVTIPIPVPTTSTAGGGGGGSNSALQPNDTTNWYNIPKDSAKNAKGKLQVRFVTRLIPPKRIIMNEITGVNSLNPKYKLYNAWLQSQQQRK